MKFLLDENMLVSFRDILRELDFEAYHVYDLGLANTPDVKIVLFAQKEGYTILTNDLDFSRIMALESATSPSVITFRLGALNPLLFREIVMLNFQGLLNDIPQGCLVTIDDGGIRIRKLPIY